MGLDEFSNAAICLSFSLEVFKYNDPKHKTATRAATAPMIGRSRLTLFLMFSFAKGQEGYQRHETHFALLSVPPNH